MHATRPAVTPASSSAAASQSLVYFRKAKNADLPVAVAKRLDSFLEQYSCSPSELGAFWELISFNQPDHFSGMAIPSSVEAVAAIEKQIQLTRRSKASANLRKPMDVTLLSSITPPTKKQRGHEGISPLAAGPPKEARMAEKSKMAILNENLSALDASADRNAKISLVSPILDAVPRYMYARLDVVAEAARTELAEFGKMLLAEGKLLVPKGSEELVPTFDPVGAPVHGRNVLVLGRVVCDGEAVKLNTKSALLEGANGVRVTLDFDSFAARFSIFPGQHLAVEGGCAGGGLIQVERLYEGSVMPPPSSLHSCSASKIWVASGPFTDAQSLEFTPLTALLHECNAQRPDVLVLVGPLVDAEHPLIKAGSPELEGIGHVSFDDVFAYCLSRINATLANDVKTRVVIVPSADDVTHPHVALPQPGFVVPKDVEADRFEMMPNPCVFRVGGEQGPVIGVGNVDVLFHFMEEGSPFQGASEGLSRLTNHLLMQRSFYPLVPANTEACVDLSQRTRLRLPPVDMLVCPSRLARFAHTTHGILCVNPGKSIPAKTSAALYMIDVHDGEGVLAEKARVELRTVDF